MDEQDHPRLLGMTVNERLFHVGVLDQWDAAVGRRGRQKLIALREQVDVIDPRFTVDTILARPKASGV